VTENDMKKMSNDDAGDWVNRRLVGRDDNGKEEMFLTH